MKILLIAYAYPPTPIVGAFRAAKVAEAFRRAGHQVEVVTARIPGERAALRLSEPGLRVHTVTAIPHPRHLYLWAKRLLGRGATPAGAGADAAIPKTSSVARRTYPAWKRRLLSMMKIPDGEQGFIPPVLLRSMGIMRGGVDLVYTTAPPFSDHLAGLLLKRVTGVRWAAEFRDPWSEAPEAPAELRSRPADAANRWLERQCLARADHVVAVARETRDLLAAKMEPHRRHRVVLALNGIDRIEEGSRAPEGPFRIVYTGSFSAGRDPMPFLQALASLKNRLQLTARDLRVEIIGHARAYEGRSIELYAAELGISDLLSFRDWMPQEWCRERLRGADLLLLLFRDQRVQIPNKLFDYLGARRPILALVDAQGEAARMLGDAGGHYVVTQSTTAAMEKALEIAYAERGKQLSADSEERLREWTTEQQMNRLLMALGA